MKKIIILFLLFFIKINAQWIVVNNSSELNVPNIDLGTKPISSVLDSSTLALSLHYGFNPVNIDSVVVIGSSIADNDTVLSEQFTSGQGDLLDSWDLTTWTNVSVTGTITTTSFTSTASCGLFFTTNFESGVRYKIKYAYSTTATGGVRLMWRDGTGLGSAINSYTMSASGTLTATSDKAGFYINQNGSGTTTVTILSAEKIPDNFIYNGNSLLTLNSDTSATISNLPLELTPNNGQFVFSYTDLATNGNLTNWTGDNPDNFTVANEDANNYVTESSGSARVVSNNTSAVQFYQVITTEIGATYRATFDIDIITLGWRVGFSANTSMSYANRTDEGTGLELYYTATTTATQLAFVRINTGSSEFLVDNIKIEKLVSPDGYTTSTMNATNYVVEHTEGMQWVNDGTYWTINTDIGTISGDSIDYKIEVYSFSGSGSILLMDNSLTHTFATINSATTYSGVMVNDGSKVQLKRNGSGFNAVISRVSFKKHYSESSAQVSIPTEQNRFYKVPVSYREGATNIVLGDNSTFSSSVGSWIPYSGGIVSWQTNKLRFITDNSGNSGVLIPSLSGFTEEFVTNEWYGVVLDAWHEGTLTGDFKIQLGSTGAPQTVEINSTQTKYNIVLKYSGGATTRMYLFTDGTVDTVYLDNIKVYHLDSPSQKVEEANLICQYGNQTFTLNALTSELQDTVLRLNGKVEDDWYRFDGINDWIDTDYLTASLGDTVIIECDAYLDSNGVQQTIVSSGYDFGLVKTNTDKYYIFVHDGTNTIAVTGSDITTGWNNLLFTIINGDSIKLTINNLTTIGTVLSGLRRESASKEISIGSRNSGTDQWFSGKIKNVKVWNNNNLEISYRGTDDSSITSSTWYDQSGNNNDGVVSGATPIYNPNLKFELSDTAKAIIKIGAVERIENSGKVKLNEPLLINFVTDINEPSSIPDTFYVYAEGRIYEKLIYKNIVSTQELLVETPINFDTVNTHSTDYCTIINNTANTITGITYSLDAPFFVSNAQTSLAPYEVLDLTILFSPSITGNYSGYLILNSSAGTDSIYISGYYNAPSSGTQWVMASPGGGGWYQDVEISPVDNNYIYVVTDLSGFWYSPDLGTTWYSTNPDSGDYQGSDISCHPDSLGVVYMASMSGIWKSWNHGQDWTRLGTGQIYGEQLWQHDLADSKDSSNFSAIYVNPNNPAYIYAGTGTSHGTLASNTESQGFPIPARFAISSDYGNTWSYATTGIDTAVNAFDDFAVMPNNPNFILTATKQGLYRTTNGGMSWTKIFNDNIYTVSINPTDTAEVWFVSNFWSNTDLTKIYYTNDVTATTPSFIDGSGDLSGQAETYARSLKIDGSGNIYVGNGYSSGYRLYKSTNKANFTAVSGTNIDYSWETSKASMMAVSSDGEIIAYGHDDLILRENSVRSFKSVTSKEVSTDYWTGFGADVNSIWDIDISPDGNTIITAVADHVGFISKNGGTSWKNISISGGTAGACVINPVNNDIMYISVGPTGGGQVNNQTIYKTINGGDSWTALTALTATTAYAKMAISSDGNYLYVLAYSSSSGMKLWRSSNAGVSFTSLTDVYYGRDLVIDPNDNTVLYFTQQMRSSTSYACGLVKVSNAIGTPSFTGYYNTNLGNVTGVAINPDSSGVIYVSVDGTQGLGGYAAGTEGIWKTINNGVSWTQILTPSNPLNSGAYTSVRLNPFNSSIVYASQNRVDENMDIGISDGVWKSEDGGENWSSNNDGLGLTTVRTMESDLTNGYLFAGTQSGGIWKLSPVSSSPTLPTINSFNLVANISTGSVSITMNVANNGVLNNAYVGYSTIDTSSILYTDEMTNLGSGIFTYTFNGLDTSLVYYLKARFNNELLTFVYSNSDSVAWGSGGILDSVIVYVAESKDDAHWIPGTGYTSYTNTYNNFGNNNSILNAFVRFPNVVIPSGATVTNSYLEFIASNTRTNTTVKRRVYAENTQTPAIVSTVGTDMDTRLLNHTTSYEDDNNISSWTALSTYTMNVTNIVSELNVSYDYSSGSAIAFFIIDNGSTVGATIIRSFYSFDNSSLYPVLKIFFLH